MEKNFSIAACGGKGPNPPRLIRKANIEAIAPAITAFLNGDQKELFPFVAFEAVRKSRLRELWSFWHLGVFQN